MELSLIILKQTIIMALYILLGFLLFRGKKISVEGSKSLATILLWLVIPCVLIDSFCVAPTAEKVRQLLISAALGALSLAIAIPIAKVLYRKSPVDNFSAAFSNAGFIGIPLVRACFGDEAVFFLVGFIALLNLLQWTYGASILSHGKAKMGVKEILLNPITVGLAIGVVLFATGAGVHAPTLLRDTIKNLSALNAPLAMLVLGVYLGQTDPKAMLVNARLYRLSAARLFLIPAVTLVVLWLLPIDTTMALVILTAACAPVGANVAVYAQIYGEDYPYACQTVALSTVLSVITMPLVLALGNILL